MDEQLLNALGIRNLDVEKLAFLKYALGEIDGNEGAKRLGISSNSFRVRAWRIRHRKDTHAPNKNAEPETLYKEFVQGWGRIYNYEDRIIVCLSKKRSTGCLINAPFLDGWMDGGNYVSWLKKKLEFVWM